MNDRDLQPDQSEQNTAQTAQRGARETERLETDGARSNPSLEPTTNPQRFDVLLGRGRSRVEHPGNKRLQIVVDINKARYHASNSRHEKTQISQDIVNQIKKCGTETGRFLRYDTEMGGWVEVDDEIARLKVTQALRYHGQPLKQESDSRESKKVKSGDMATAQSKIVSECDAQQRQTDEEDGGEEELFSDEDILAVLGLDPNQYSGDSTGSQTDNNDP